jgi:hypothetical protein
MQPNLLKINNYTKERIGFQKKPTRVVGFFEVDEQDQDLEPNLMDFDSQASCFNPSLAQPLTVGPESRPNFPKESYQSDLDWNISLIQPESSRVTEFVRKENTFELKAISGSACANLDKMVLLRANKCRVTSLEVKPISAAELIAKLCQKTEMPITDSPIENKHTIDFTYSCTEARPQSLIRDKRIATRNSSQGRIKRPEHKISKTETGRNRETIERGFEHQQENQRSTNLPQTPGEG